ncbi:hypothetical protein PPERSA_07045 [Pseudocohnilembus persalinus]|uniref:Uncharacterized protein n=1 Tax=Pseudocohnilembus persalinus TaxID=266149 RepID=A0A0V0QMD4_PSEPJ|nr:hypothetical protein PPERSA_07045 [Pseudocohnilembus persalinus]|eukprot:KRX03217.1 hypothetical protein PPERSA_07045 [Pseudocohnilembus persalinus]
MLHTSKFIQYLIQQFPENIQNEILKPAIAQNFVDQQQKKVSKTENSTGKKQSTSYSANSNQKQGKQTSKFTTNNENINPNKKYSQENRNIAHRPPTEWRAGDQNIFNRENSSKNRQKQIESQKAQNLKNQIYPNWYQDMQKRTGPQIPKKITPKITETLPPKSRSNNQFPKKTLNPQQIQQNQSSLQVKKRSISGKRSVNQFRHHLDDSEIKNALHDPEELENPQHFARRIEQTHYNDQDQNQYQQHLIWQQQQHQKQLQQSSIQYKIPFKDLNDYQKMENLQKYTEKLQKMESESYKRQNRNMRSSSYNESVSKSHNNFIRNSNFKKAAGRRRSETNQSIPSYLKNVESKIKNQVERDRQKSFHEKQKQRQYQQLENQQYNQVFNGSNEQTQQL